MNKTYDFMLKYIRDKVSSVNIGHFYDILEADVDWKEIKSMLKGLPYSSYLKTRYWRIISKFLRHSQNCSKCGYDAKLHVHHKTYKYLGEDHLHLDNLEVLCKMCHRKEHKGISVTEKKKRISDLKPKERMTYKQRTLLRDLLIANKDKHNKKRLRDGKISKDEGSRMIALLVKEKSNFKH